MINSDLTARKCSSIFCRYEMSSAWRRRLSSFQEVQPKSSDRKKIIRKIFQTQIPISLWRGQSITNHLQRMKEEDSRLTSIANPTLHFNSIIRHNQYTLMPVHVLAGPGCQKASSLHLALVSLLMYYFVASPPYSFVWLQLQ